MFVRCSRGCSPNPPEDVLPIRGVLPRGASEGGLPDTFRGYCRDPAASLLDGTVDDGEPQPRARPDRLGCMEGLKDMLQDCWRNPRTGVRDAETDELTRARIGVFVDIGRVDGHVPRAYCQRPLALHGITCVHGKVEQDLGQL